MKGRRTQRTEAIVIKAGFKGVEARGCGDAAVGRWADIGMIEYGGEKDGILMG
jgi:hypothetical protein